MDVVSLCPLPSALLCWQPSPSRWALTVVCKATYRLEPGASPIAAEQEPINDHENHWDDDPERSLYAPSDLVPFKPRADVVLVGSAHARHGQPVRSLVARMSVAGIDKAIEVLCPRVRTRDGELRDGKRWAKMPLLYERAAGGAETDNPVGMGRATPRDLYGQVQLPNLQLPGGDERFEPVGFGPIAASWPPRKRLAARAATDTALRRAPFGDGFDPLYFQAAPPDQQVERLRPGEAITLENLHPKHPRLSTTLAAARPRALVELAGQAARELELVPDTLWIDTHRALCALTFRAHFDVDGPDPQGRILVALPSGDQPIPWAQIAPPPPAPRPAEPSLSEIDLSDLFDSVEITQTEEAERLLLDTSVLDPGADQAALPFIPAPPGWTPPAVIAFGPPPPAASSPGAHQTTQKLEMTAFRTALPAWLEAGSPPPSPTPPSPPPAFPPAAPPLPPRVTPRPALLPIASSAAAESPPPSVLSASNAAAGQATRSGEVQPPELRSTSAPPAAVILDLLYWDPGLGARLDQAPSFARFRPSPAPSPLPKPPPGEGPAAEASGGATASRGLVHAILTQGAPRSARELEAALDEAEDQRPFEAPLVLLGGDLELCFDETEMLRAVVSAASPLAGTDKKLNEALELSTAMLKTPLLGMPEVALGLAARIHEAWGRVNRLLPASYLASSSERLLLQQRHYQKRTLLSAVWIRALLSGPELEGAIPIYLPASLETQLPLFRRFRARVLGELLWQQDQYEAHPLAIRALALGRVSTRARTRPAKSASKP